MQNSPIRVTLPTHTLEFMEDENQLIIRMQSLDHTTKGQTKFSPDTIAQMSNGFLERSREVIEWINTIKNEDNNFEIIEKNLRINFKYMLGPIEKAKTIIFPLNITTNDDITVLKLENTQLKSKVSKLQDEVVSLRQELQKQKVSFTQELKNQAASLTQELKNQTASLTQVINSRFNSTDQRINSFKWEEINLDLTNEFFYPQFDYQVIRSNQTYFFGQAYNGIQNYWSDVRYIAGQCSYTIRYNTRKRDSSGNQIKKILRRKKEI